MNFTYDFAGSNTRFICDSEPGEVLVPDIWQKLQSGSVKSMFLPVSLEETSSGWRFVFDIEGTVNMRAWMDAASYDERSLMQKKAERIVDKLQNQSIGKEFLLLEEKFQYVDIHTEEVRFICIPLQKEKKVSQKPYMGEMHFYSQEEPPLPPIPPTPSAGVIFEEESLGDKKKKPFWARKKDREKSIPEIFPPIDETWENPVQEFGGLPPVPEPPVHDFYAMPEWRMETPLQEVNGKEAWETGDDGTTLLQEDGNDGTVLLRALHRPPAELVRIRTQECFPINKDSCKIGKRAAAVDICIRNNPTVSREHCVIRYNDGDFYLEDCGSSNYTYLEGERVIPGQAVRLSDRCVIRMSDEEFIFQEDSVEGRNKV